MSEASLVLKLLFECLPIIQYLVHTDLSRTGRTWRLQLVSVKVSTLKTCSTVCEKSELMGSLYVGNFDLKLLLIW